MPGPPDVLELRDVPEPTPGSGQVLIRVRASALNRADLLQREGRYPAPPGAAAEIPGIEFAGEVTETGAGVSAWRVGQRVFGITGGGAHAELLVAHERAIAEIPDNLDWTSAAAVPEAFITAHDAMLVQAGLRPGERVLIHAVGSGVGVAAVQLARAISAVPFGTARTADKIDRAREYGLEDGSTDPDAFDDMNVVIDLVGGPYVEKSIDALAVRGRLMLVGTVGGGRGELPLGKVLGKRLRITGTALRARPLEEKILATRAFAAEVVPLLAAGTVRPVIDCVFPLEDIREAHALLGSNATFGKVVLTVG